MPVEKHTSIKQRQFPQMQTLPLHKQQLQLTPLLLEHQVSIKQKDCKSNMQRQMNPQLGLLQLKESFSWTNGFEK